NTSTAMWINGLTFFVCAWAIASLPTIATEEVEGRVRLTWKIIRQDFIQVWYFIRKQPQLLMFFSLYTVALMIAFALDSQEMTFLKDVLQTTDTVYGMVVSVAGIGAILGGICATSLAGKLSLQTYIGMGFSLTMASYMAFYASHALWLATVSFVALGFFMAFSNTGYATMYQKTIPPELMGRFGSSLNLLQSVAQIIFTLILGLIAEWYSLQIATIVFSLVALMLAVYFNFYIIRHAKTLQLKVV
ncbi:MAG: MFS transporter, partial [Lysinibacillus sp.]